MSLLDLSWIVSGLAKPGKSKSGLAAALGRSPSMVTDLLKGERRLRLDEVQRVASYLEVPPPALGDVEIEIIGKAGAGPSGEIEFGTSQGQLGTAPAPPGATYSTKAIEVEGSSMRPLANDGWLVYYDDETRRPIDDTMIGLPCVCWLADGRILIKTPYRAGNGAFNLESYSSAYDTIRDVIVDSAAVVTAIVPRPPLSRILHRRNAA